MGLEVAAVDMLDVQGAPKVFEVQSSSPALAEMEKAVGRGPGQPIVARAEDRPASGRRAGPSPLPAFRAYAPIAQAAEAGPGISI